jgi:sulfate transport system ATP-binding protein
MESHLGISISNLSRRFGRTTVLERISLQIARGELLGLLGPSGSGKTTLLRIIAGLEYQDEGCVMIDGVDASALEVKARRVGFVFQHYALFGQLSVFENIAFGLRVRPRRLRPIETEITRRVQQLLALVQLEGYGKRFPHQLSGGQRQRVALARALAIEPRVLLLDEPFGALDAKVRLDLRQWLRQLQRELAMTTVLVTHDQQEAMQISDRVALMHDGHIAQVGSPTQLRDAPASGFVQAFLG